MLSNPTYIYVLPLMALNIIPRMLNLVIFFGVWNIEKAIECALISIQAFLIYLVGFALMIRKLYSWKKNAQFLCQSFLTSFFGPCIVMCADSKLIFWSSLGK